MQTVLTRPNASLQIQSLSDNANQTKKGSKTPLKVIKKTQEPMTALGSVLKDCEKPYFLLLAFSSGTGKPRSRMRASILASRPRKRR